MWRRRNMEGCKSSCNPLQLWVKQRQHLTIQHIRCIFSFRFRLVAMAGVECSQIAEALKQRQRGGFKQPLARSYGSCRFCCCHVCLPTRTHDGCCRFLTGGVGTRRLMVLLAAVHVCITRHASGRGIGVCFVADVFEFRAELVAYLKHP